MGYVVFKCLWFGVRIHNPMRIPHRSRRRGMLMMNGWESHGAALRLAPAIVLHIGITNKVEIAHLYIGSIFCECSSVSVVKI